MKVLLSTCRAIRFWLRLGFFGFVKSFVCEIDEVLFALLFILIFVILFFCGLVVVVLIGDIEFLSGDMFTFVYAFAL